MTDMSAKHLYTKKSVTAVNSGAFMKSDDKKEIDVS
jgi:hypothetical protein